MSRGLCVEQCGSGFDVTIGEFVGFRELCLLAFGGGEFAKCEDLLIGKDGSEVGMIVIDALQPQAIEHMESSGVLKEVDLLLHLLWGEPGRVGGLSGEGGGMSDGQRHVAVALECAIQVEVGVGVFGDFLPRHHREDISLAGGCPGGSQGFEDVVRPQDDAGKIGLCGFGVLLQIGEDAEIVVQDGGVTEITIDLVAVDRAVFLTLFGEGLPGFFDLFTMMKVFYGLFEGDGDQEADDDGGDVDEEISPGVGGVVRWVDIEHGSGFLRGVRGGVRREVRLLRRDGVGFGHRLNFEDKSSAEVRGVSLKSGERRN